MATTTKPLEERDAALLELIDLLRHHDRNTQVRLIASAIIFLGLRNLSRADLDMQE